MDEEIGDSLPKARLGCFVYYPDSNNLIDTIMIREGAHQVKPDTVTIPLDHYADDAAKLVIICKDIAENEPYAGSLSIPQAVF